MGVIRIDFINSEMFTVEKLKRVFCGYASHTETLEDGLCRLAKFERAEILQMYPAIFLITCDVSDMLTIYATFDRSCKLLRTTDNEACFFVSVPLTRLRELLEISRSAKFKKTADQTSKMLLSELTEVASWIFWFLNMMNIEKPITAGRKKTS